MTSYTGQTSMDIGPELTGIDLAPDSLVTVIIDRGSRSAFGAAPGGARSIFNPDIHPTGSSIKLEFGYAPRIVKIKQLLVQLCIAHRHPVLSFSADTIIQSLP
ncbi:MAG: hypothetical protein AVO38_16235 [delta proteobacterium ML8_D]|nr:MAG: hypothetical protein AVO38_16235 [delta proteobacterium ML8_D]